jgi:hypothetical protein
MERFRLSLVTLELDGLEHLVFAEAVEEKPWGGATSASDTRRVLTLTTGRQLPFRFVVAPMKEALLIALCQQAERGSFAFGTLSVICDQLIARPAVLVPAGSASEGSLSPDNAFTYRLLEHYSPKETTLYELRATRQYPAIVQFIGAHAGIDLGTFTDRVGNFLAFWRISPWRLETRAPLDQQHRWVRALEGAALPTRMLRLRTRFFEYGELMEETISDLPPSGAHFQLPTDATAFDLSLFDPMTGVLLAADGGRFLTGFGVSTRISQDETFVVRGVSHTVQWVHSDSPGPVVDLNKPWRTRSGLRRVRALHAAEARQVRISDGTDRVNVVTMLRDILVQAPTHVEIWDPYFCANDVLDFLPWIAPFAKCRVLCGTRLTRTAHVATSPCIAALQLQLAVVRTLPSSRNVELRYRVAQHASTPTTWNPIYHDRFLVTDSGAWVLGASLNGIGNKPGAIIALQNPEQLLGMFDDEWNRPVPPPEFEVSL